MILLGEHFVVHGALALSLAIDKYARVEVAATSEPELSVESRTLGVREVYRLRDLSPLAGDERMVVWARVLQRIANEFSWGGGFAVTIDSKIPPSAGLGSSASISAALAAAAAASLGHELPRGKILEFAAEAERYFHGRPSGIDHTTVAYGGLLLFDGKTKSFERREVGGFCIIVGNTGIVRRTAELVRAVGEFKKKNPSEFDSMVKKMTAMSKEGFSALEARDFVRLGELMDEAHSMLRKIGVSNAALDKLVDAARRAGAYGAKLTGAGGGGCMVALADEETTEAVFEAIAKAGGQPFIAKPDNLGVRVERG